MTPTKEISMRLRLCMSPTARYLLHIPGHTKQYQSSELSENLEKPNELAFARGEVAAVGSGQLTLQGVH